MLPPVLEKEDTVNQRQKGKFISQNQNKSELIHNETKMNLFQSVAKKKFLLCSLKHCGAELRMPTGSLIDDITHGGANLERKTSK